jgi:ribosomal protein S27E
MGLKFRLKGLAETFIDQVKCPCCGHDGGEEGDQGFRTDLTRVTYEGIVVVISCELCGNIFVPDGQRHGIINTQKLRLAVERDSIKTGQPLYSDRNSVRLDVERLNAERGSGVH